MSTNNVLTSNTHTSVMSKWSPKYFISLVVLTVICFLLFTSLSANAAVPTIGLGAADSFAVLAGAGITNTGPTVINGDVGSFPTPAQTGFGSVVLTGTNHADDSVTQQAKDDLTTAYNQAAGSGPPTSVPVELGGTTLTPGVYNGTTLEITGTLTLNTLGDPNAVFIFQSGSTLITAADSSVVILNGATACNVFWQVPSSATLGTDSHLIGTVLASVDIQATNGASVEGRLLADGAVTLDTNTITRVGCILPTAVTTTTTADTTDLTGQDTPNNGSGVPPGLPDTGFDKRIFYFGSFITILGVFFVCLSRIRQQKIIS